LDEDDMRGITLISEFLNREHDEDYKGIIDIRAELKDGTQIQIEMQVSNQYNMDKRSLYYWSGMYYSQFEKSELYKNLRKCISINILAFDYRKTDKAYSRYVLKEYESNEILTDMLDIRFIELPKRSDVPNVRLKKWLDLIASRSFSEMIELSKGDGQMERVAEETYRINSDIDRRVDLERREKFRRDQLSLQHEAEERGRIEGKKEIAKNRSERGYP
jgi:predicted transposase/invertase (TIGR01784 family)